MSIFDFKIKNGELIKYKGKDVNVIVPNSVTSIGRFAFDGCSFLKSVTMGSSVTSIGWSAFLLCTSLENVILSNSVSEIDNCAFSECYSLKSIAIPNSVISIGDNAFAGTPLTSISIPASVEVINNAFYSCNTLTNITVDINNKNYRSVGGNLYSKDGTSLLRYAMGKDEPIFSIPNTVRNIGAYAFSNCASLGAPSGRLSLSSVVISESVTSIGDYAFADCISIETIIIPDTVQTIGEYAFSGCNNATIILSDKPRAIADNAFNGCKKVEYQKYNEMPQKSESSIEQEDGFKNGISYNSDNYVFISYSTKNQEYAEAARHLLSESSINAWMAPYDIPAGSKYAHVINNAIKNCSCVLLLLSEQSQESEWVEKEIERAINYKKTIISMHLDDSQLNDGFGFYLGNQQIVPVKTINSNDENVKKVLNAIRSFII